MADDKTITTVFRADISQFSSSTQELNKYIKTVNSEFKLATASMEKWSDNTDGLQAKITQLNKILEAEQKKLGDLEDAYAELVKEGNENSNQAKALAIRINEQKAVVQRTEKEIDKYNGTLKDLQKAGVKSTDELAKLNKKAEDNKKAFEKATQTIQKGFLAAVGAIAGACIGAIKGLNSIVEKSRELRLEQGRVQSAFEQAGFTIEDSKRIYNDFNVVLGDTAKTTEALQLIAQLATTQDELNEIVRAGIGVYAKYGNAIPVEKLIEAATETARTGELTGRLSDAISWAGLNENEFQKQLKACSSEQQRQSLIVKTLNNLYGEAGDTYKETNKDLIAAEQAQSDYNDKMAEIATKVQPALTQLKLTFVEALTAVVNKFSEADIEKLIGNIANAINVLVTKVLPPLLKILSWILENLNWLGPTVLTVVGAITALSVAFKTIAAIMNVVKVAQIALNIVMNANPIGLIITAIGLLVTAFVVLWKKCEGFRNFWKNLWEGIKTVAIKAKDFLVNVFKGVANIMLMPINNVIKLINLAIKGINKIKVDIPEWVPGIGGKSIGFNIPTLPEAKLAKGGIIDKPTLALVGEAGKEAVMPLENNTKWMDTLADKLSNKMQAKNVTNNYQFDYKFEKMETTQLALHKAQLETRKLIKEGV